MKDNSDTQILKTVFLGKQDTILTKEEPALESPV